MPYGFGNPADFILDAVIPSRTAGIPAPAALFCPIVAEFLFDCLLDRKKTVDNAIV
jgi:hypothetical protein